jgi:hypothetical protein
MSLSAFLGTLQDLCRRRVWREVFELSLTFSQPEPQSPLVNSVSANPDTPANLNR